MSLSIQWQFMSLILLITVLSASSLRFIKDFMNVIDIMAIIPFFLSLVLEGLNDFDDIGKTGKIIRLVRIMQILRIFKLVRHFAGLQSLFYTLQQAYKELDLLLVLVAVAILTYSTLVYFAERDRADGLNCTGWEPDYASGNLGNAIKPSLLLLDIRGFLLVGPHDNLYSRI